MPAPANDEAFFEEYGIDCPLGDLFKAFKQMQEDWKKPFLEPTNDNQKQRISVG